MSTINVKETALYKQYLAEGVEIYFDNKPVTIYSNKYTTQPNNKKILKRIYCFVFTYTYDEINDTSNVYYGASISVINSKYTNNSDNLTKHYTHNKDCITDVANGRFDKKTCLYQIPNFIDKINLYKTKYLFSLKTNVRKNKCLNISHVINEILLEHVISLRLKNNVPNTLGLCGSKRIIIIKTKSDSDTKSTDTVSNDDEIETNFIVPLSDRSATIIPVSG